MSSPGAVEAPTSPAGTRCSFCGAAYTGAPNRCSRCGTLLGEAAKDLQRIGEAKRRLIRTRKALADTFFLVGLLLGGPMITLGTQTHLGAFIVFAGGVASLLRRHTDWSTPGTVLVGSLVAMVAASWFAGSPTTTPEEASAAADARGAYARALAAQDPDVMVEARGPGLVALWYTIPKAMTGSCGAYPPKEVRSHLAELGFRRIVVNEPNESGGICSFEP